jgi:NAD-dependent dihydropyrimidine dehydrogenase PreA subunit
MNLQAVDQTLQHLYEIPLPAIPQPETIPPLKPAVSDRAPAFVQTVLGPMLQRQGDTIPVSALPCDGTYPTGTAQWEKRNIAQAIPVWDPEVCVQCGKCVMVCPHAVIRSKVYEPEQFAKAPDNFKHTAGPRVDRPAVHDSGGGGRLHRLRHLCGCVPRQKQIHFPAQGDQYDAGLSNRLWANRLQG